MLKAIETSYLGYKFRSRLEAKWAVFLRTAGVEFEYEPEGFETSAGRYLPDFFLPALGEWLEIKPRIELLRAYDLERIQAFAASIHILTGQPWPTEYRFYDGAGAPTRAIWMTCPACGTVCFSPVQKLPGEQRFWCQACELANDLRNGFGYTRDPQALDSGAVCLAFGAARRARFEHGETP